MCDSFYSDFIAFASVVDARRRLHGEAIDGYGGGLLHIEAIHLVAHESLVAAGALVVHAALVRGLRAQVENLVKIAKSYSLNADQRDLVRAALVRHTLENLK